MFTAPRSFTVIDTVITEPAVVKKDTKNPALNDITFNWQAVTGINKYELEYDTISSPTTPNVLAPLAQDSSFIVNC